MFIALHCVRCFFPCVPRCITLFSRPPPGNRYHLLTVNSWLDGKSGKALRKLQEELYVGMTADDVAAASVAAKKMQKAAEVRLSQSISLSVYQSISLSVFGSCVILTIQISGC